MFIIGVEITSFRYGDSVLLRVNLTSINEFTQQSINGLKHTHGIAIFPHEYARKLDPDHCVVSTKPHALAPVCLIEMGS